MVRILILLAIATSVFAQQFDAFGGLMSVVGSGHPHTQSATCSQSGTTQTCTVSSGSVFGINEPMLISGTGTVMDWVFDGVDPHAGASIITGIAGNTVTLTAHHTNSVPSTSGSIRPGLWYVQTVGGWVRLFDPENHWVFLETMGQPNVAQVSTKYANNGCAAAAANLAQFKSWNFNGISNDATPQGYYWSDSSGVCSNQKVPEFYESHVSQYASDNLGSYLDQAIKNIDYGMDAHYGCTLRRPQIDYFDSRWSTFLQDFLTEWSDPLSITYSSPFNTGIQIDDTGWVLLADSGPEFHTVPAGNNDCDGALAVLVTSPHQTYNPTTIYGTDNPYIYADSKVYSKVAATSPPATCSIATPCSLRDFLAKKYGTVSALNAAWSSSYTTFDSSETTVTGETAGTGDGSTLSFSHTMHTSVTPFSVQVLVAGTVIGGDCPAFATPAYVAQPCPVAVGTGTIAGTTASGLSGGSVTYSSGAITITFSAGHAPAGGAAITLNYTWGGWDAGGTGLMDEDGAGSWVGTNYRCLTSLPSWQSGHAYSVNDEIHDSTSGTWQIATQSGASGGIAPTFSATAGNITTDNGVKWASIGTPVCGVGGDFSAPNANQTMASDIDTWLGQLAGRYLGPYKAVLNSTFPDLLFWGPDQLGVAATAPRSQVLQAAQQYVDVGFTQLIDTSIDPNGPEKYSFFTQFFTGPIHTYQSWASAQTSTGCGGVGPTYCRSTNSDRGQRWYDTMSWFNTAVGYDGLKHFAGAQWWGSHDLQGVGWGIKSSLDNGYDGHEDVNPVVSCSQPNPLLSCGGESGIANFLGTDAIHGSGTGIATANAIWYGSFSNNSHSGKVSISGSGSIH